MDINKLALLISKIMKEKKNYVINKNSINDILQDIINEIPLYAKMKHKARFRLLRRRILNIWQRNRGSVRDLVQISSDIFISNSASELKDTNKNNFFEINDTKCTNIVTCSDQIRDSYSSLQHSRHISPINLLNFSTSDIDKEEIQETVDCNNMFQYTDISNLSKENEEENLIDCTTSEKPTTTSRLDLKNSPFLFSFELEIKKANRLNILHNGEIRHEIIRKHLLENGITCVVLFKGTHYRRKTNGPYMIEYAFCKHEGCKKYRIEIFSVKILIEFVIKSVGATNHTTAKHALQLRGIERREIKNKLIFENPLNVRDQHIKKADSEIIRDGNLQNIRSLAVYQKARTEAMEDGDYMKDPYLDLLLRSINETNNDYKYIQFPTGRTLVYLYCKFHIRCLVKSNQSRTVYFDSTGSVVRSTDFDAGRKIYYYAAVVRINGKVIPIAELISAEHDAITIGTFLRHFKRFVEVKCKKRWPIFSEVVVDWSLANVMGLCQGFNNMTVYQYLKIIYTYLTSELPLNVDISTMVTIHFCCAHFMKMVSNRMTKCGIDKKRKPLLLQTVAYLLQRITMDELALAFKNLLLLLLPKCKRSDAKKSIKYLSDSSIIAFSEIEKLKTEFTVHDNDEFPVDGKIFDSPFFKYFQVIYDAVLKEIDMEDDPDEHNRNKFRNIKFAEYLLQFCMPFVPMWTSIVPYRKNNAAQQPLRFSNANVECWFKILKKDVLQGSQPLKLGRFVEITKNKINADLKTIELGLHKTKKKKNIKLSPKNVKIDDPQAEEIWKKKKCKGKTYFQRTEKIFEDSNIHSGINSNVPSVIPEMDLNTANKNNVTISPVEDQNDTNKNEIIVEMDDFSQKLLLPNGLIYNSTYYLSAALKNIRYTVASFVNFNLASEDYSTLTTINTDKTGWLTGDIINVCAQFLIESTSHIYLVSTYVVTVLLDAEKFDTNYEKTMCHIDFKKEFILLPYNANGNHWVLIVLDTSITKWFYLDPFGTKQPGHDIIKKVNNFIRRKIMFEKTGSLRIWEGESGNSWNEVLGIYSVQKDTHNCGIFVLYYIEIIAGLKEMSKFSETSNKNFDPAEYRLFWQRYLLLKSNIIHNKCLLCGRTGRKPDWIICNTCQRKTHKTCVIKCYDIENKDEINNVYSCSLCKNMYPYQYENTGNAEGKINMTLMEIEEFVKLCKVDLIDLSCMTKQMELFDFDYCTESFTFRCLRNICLSIKNHVPQCTDPKYRCCVLLPHVCKVIFRYHHGITDQYMSQDIMYKSAFPTGNISKLPNASFKLTDFLNI